MSKKQISPDHHYIWGICDSLESTLCLPLLEGKGYIFNFLLFYICHSINHLYQKAIWILRNAVVVCLLCFLLARFISNNRRVLKQQLGITMFCLVTSDSQRKTHLERKVFFHMSFPYRSLLCSLPLCSSILLSTFTYNGHWFICFMGEMWLKGCNLSVSLTSSWHFLFSNLTF